MDSYKTNSNASPNFVGSCQSVNSKRKYVTPNCNDVLCGRGRTAFEHPGNQRLREKIAVTLDKYNSCGSRQERSTVILETVNAIMIDQGGRFLKSDKETGKWYDGGIAAAKLRVSTAFRDARIPNKVKCMEVLKEMSSIEGQSAYQSHESTLQDSFSTLSTHLMETDMIPFPFIAETNMPRHPYQSVNLYDEALTERLQCNLDAEQVCDAFEKMDCDTNSTSSKSLDLNALYDDGDVELKKEIESLELNILGTMIQFNTTEVRR
eukprot:CAMPEP_0178907696 /NCGR_PEP_ID=MMETSP0786-20121207/7516_1 /TAXON_ID=186022 /ORGANISM="Thalassionema frauenfeldii, Strain CCMP 1798" /LENGTH=263 /DNA_ID=CAMNT_0020579527 /DNA_START=57 /DNA_END=848 /DNA_ORIENTATION=-